MRTGKWQTVFVCAVLGMAYVVSFANPLQNAYRKGDEREQYLKRYRLVWEQTETRYLFPQNPANVYQQYSQLEKEIRARGVQDVHALRERLQHEARRDIAGRQETSVSEWEIEWGKQFLRLSRRKRMEHQRVEGTGRYLLHGYEGYRWYLGDGIGVAVNDTVPSISSEQAGQPSPRVAPAPIRIWCCEGECYRHEVRDILDVSPEEIALIAGLNLLRVRGANWTTTETLPNRLVLACNRVSGDNGQIIIKATLLSKYGWLSQWVWLENRPLRIEINVQQFKQVDGYWMPQQIEVKEQFPPVGEIRRIWRLKGIFPAGRNVSLDELSSIPTVKETGVIDYRLTGCVPELPYSEATYNRMYASYSWQGRLPSLQELRRMQPQQAHSRRGVRGSFPWRLVPPILLIVIGALWYWKLKVKKSA
ncbi:MAG: hypothetical protein HPY54_14705 [Chthonomonadetes bacterium]|nr:hypothetical protein [Chthonomonadetes bacterium]